MLPRLLPQIGNEPLPPGNSQRPPCFSSEPLGFASWSGPQAALKQGVMS